MDTIEKRLEKLEKKIRVYRILFYSLGSTILFFIVSSFIPKEISVPERIQAKSFQVVGSNGEILATMEAFDGSGVITTYNSSGQILADIIPTIHGSGGLIMYDGKGKQNIILSNVSGIGGGNLRINNGDGTQVFAIGQTTQKDGHIGIFNSFGQKVVELTSDVNSDGVVLTYSRYENKTARMPY